MVPRKNLLSGTAMRTIMRKCILFGILLLLFCLSSHTSFVLADEANAAAAIASAEEKIIACYQAVSEADGAGANTETLLIILNEAGALLSHAHFAYNAGNFDAAADYAVQSQQRLNNFVAEANALKQTAIQQQSQDFTTNVVYSIAGTFIVLGASAAIWFLLRRKDKQLGAQADESSRV